jgi:hypothetical protein
MKLVQLAERSYYRKNHTCKTPDAVYSTKIGGDTVSISVKLPFDLELTKDKSKKLEADLHYAVEEVLSSLF